VARRPITSPIARPGRKYISGLIYLAVVIFVGLGLLSLRFLLG
jgi:hypothetical protein